MAVRTKSRVWSQPKRSERRRGLCRSQVSLVQKPRTVGLSFRYESEVKCLGLTRRTEKCWKWREQAWDGMVRAGVVSWWSETVVPKFGGGRSGMAGRQERQEKGVLSLG